MVDGYVKTIGPTSATLSHYWRIVAHLGGCKTEVFWGHAKLLKGVTGKRVAAAKKRGWESFDFEIVELVETFG
jgi:hypothetical protein